MYIYILGLTNNKYYIGKTKNPGFRIQDHLDGNGSLWTKKYKPLDLIKLIETNDSFDEDKYTLKYMEKYGIDNVRGGSFCEEKLSQDNIKTILKMINGSTDKCYICGEKGHFASKCILQVEYQINNLKKLIKKSGIKKIKKYFEYSSDSSNDYISSDESPSFGDSSDSSNDYISSDESPSFGREKCIDMIDSNWSCSYCGKNFKTKKGASFHENVYCKKKYSKPLKTNNYKNFKNTKQTKQINQTCYRCGRTGHFSSNCFASTHIKGYYL